MAGVVRTLVGGLELELGFLVGNVVKDGFVDLVETVAVVVTGKAVPSAVGVVEVFSVLVDVTRPHAVRLFSVNIRVGCVDIETDGVDD